MLTREEAAVLSDAELTKRMTERERTFVREWLMDQNGTQAAIRAGYAEKNAASQASRLLRKPTVQEYRDRLVRESCAASGITPDFIKLGCFEVYQRCMSKKPVLEWDASARSWVESGDWQFDARGALKALEAMANLLREQDGKSKDAGRGAAAGETLEEYLARLDREETTA